MATKGIKGAQIHATGGRPANLHHPTNVTGHINRHASVKSVHNNIKASVGKEGFFMGKQAHGPQTVHEARGKHLA